MRLGIDADQTGLEIGSIADRYGNQRHLDEAQGDGHLGLGRLAGVEAGGFDLVLAGFGGGDRDGFALRRGQGDLFGSWPDCRPAGDDRRIVENRGQSNTLVRAHADGESLGEALASG